MCLLVCGALVLAGCDIAPQDGHDQTTTAAQPTAAGQNLSFTTVAKEIDFNSNPSRREPQVLVITSLQDFEAALRLATVGDPPGLTTSPHPIEQARQLDYSHSFAILVLQGWQGTSGYSVTVDRVVRQGDRVQVLATFVRPNDVEGPVVTLAVETDPYHLIAIEKTGAWQQEIRFELVEKDQVVAETTHFIP
jgi:hypothetical protein